MKRLLFLVILLSAQAAFSQVRTPKIGYVYPAGGQRGTTFEVLVGGRQISRCNDVLISGAGVRGRIVRSYGQMGIVGSDDGQVARFLYDEAKKYVETGETKIPVLKAVQQRIDREIQKHKEKDGTDLSLPGPETVVDRHPYLYLLVDPNADALQTVFYEYLAPRPVRRPPEALGQGVHLEITIDPDAEPGDRDFRLLVGGVLSPPVRFLVGTLPEVSELEPNDAAYKKLDTLELWGRYLSQAPKTIRQLETLELPVVVNGQIRNGDVDRFTFHAVKGQKLVLGVRARHLVPYLADGVPGWFEAAVTLYDPDGKKIVGASSYRHEPDPVLTVEIPKNGVYAVEIQDSIFRGREDFVYRLSIAETPLVTSVFPLGGSTKSSTGANIDGWNLREKIAVLDTDGKSGIFEKKFLGNVWLPYPIRYAVDSLPEQREAEPNDMPKKASRIKLPVIVNGRIDSVDDVDFFTFTGKKGDIVVLDVAARSLNSPLDASLELLGGNGEIIAQNDDRADCNGPNIGLETHHADPYIMTELPKDGTYTVRLYNIMRRGGPEFGYRLRISKPRPDFAVYCEPTSVNFLGAIQPLAIHIIRKDGFDGEIRLRVNEKRSGDGFRLDGTRIPPGVDRINVTLLASPAWDGKPKEIFLEAIGQSDNREIVRPVTAVDDWEQAFIYHHLVPAESLMISRISSRRGMPPGAGFAQPPKETMVLDRNGGTVKLVFSLIPLPDHPKARQAAEERKNILSRTTFSPHQLPPDFSVVKTEVEDRRIVIHVQYPKAGDTNPGEGNLVIAMTVKPDLKKSETVPIGVLPAVAYRFRE